MCKQLVCGWSSTPTIASTYSFGVRRGTCRRVLRGLPLSASATDQTRPSPAPTASSLLCLVTPGARRIDNFHLSAPETPTSDFRCLRALASSPRPAVRRSHFHNGPKRLTTTTLSLSLSALPHSAACAIEMRRI